METNLIEDILIYLPEWTNKPLKHTSKGPPKECNHEIPAFIDEYSNQEVSQVEYNYRKHISNEEIIHQYHLTKIQVASWLHRENVPNTRDCYIATCMWTAGVLEEKYNYRRVSSLIQEAKEILEPYILVYFRVLDNHKHHHHHHHKWDNTLVLTITEELPQTETIEEQNIVDNTGNLILPFKEVDLNQLKFGPTGKHWGGPEGKIQSGAFFFRGEYPIKWPVHIELKIIGVESYLNNIPLPTTIGGLSFDKDTDNNKLIVNGYMNFSYTSEDMIDIPEDPVPLSLTLKIDHENLNTEFTVKGLVDLNTGEYFPQDN